MPKLPRHRAFITEDRRSRCGLCEVNGAMLSYRSVPSGRSACHIPKRILHPEGQSVNFHNQERRAKEVNLKHTSKIITLIVNSTEVPARAWEGATKNGVCRHAFITRIAVNKADNAVEFERDLKEQSKPSAEVAAIATHDYLRRRASQKSRHHRNRRRASS